jgi:hypothetical protein
MSVQPALLCNRNIFCVGRINTQGTCRTANYRASELDDFSLFSYHRFVAWLGDNLVLSDIQSMVNEAENN